MLADPDPQLQAQSSALSEQIRRATEQNGGWIGFDRYMELALYSPGLGYYAAGAEKFGCDGDFVTAPVIGEQFAECIAVQCEEILQLDGLDTIYEFGGGEGSLAATVLSFLSRIGTAPVNYFFVETSADLRDRQQQAITRLRQNQGDMLSTRVEWLDALPDALSGIVLGNEVLDAMPFGRFTVDRDGVPRELGVSWHRDGPCWSTSDRALPQSADLPLLASGYEGEWLQQAEAWVASIGERLDQGVLLLIDYGFPRGEFYHPDRNCGTLMCHYRHHAHGDPFFYPGLQDITCHVDFTAIARAGEAAGLNLLGYASQADFLLSCGLLERLAERQQREEPDDRVNLELAAEIKKLTMPHEMGELFKVIAMGRGVDGPLRGFLRANKMYRLVDD